MGLPSIENYEIIEKISETRNSIVYRCKQKKSGGTVIIKMLNALYPSPSDIGRFKQEYEIIIHLELEGIIKVFDIIQVKDTYALVLEDFNGVNLDEVIQSSGFNVEAFLHIAVSLSKTLGELHKMNIIHRDIKPRNILVNEEKQIVKITDFGISSEFTNENNEIYNPAVMEGTLTYMSPEQTGRMNYSVDYRTDLYSLGITFYKMITGRVPFTSNDPMELIHSHIARKPEPPYEINKNCPVILSDIVLKLLSKTPQERYQNCFGLMADLKKCQDQYFKNEKVEPFNLAMEDISIRFKIPQILVGRENEISMLISGFERASRGSTEVMLVSGHPGIGKSALINEIHKPMVAKRGYFLSGKYDQFRRDVPYSAIIQSFQGLAAQILTESDDMIARWKQELSEALKNNGKVILDVIPLVEHIIGKQSELPELGPEETQNRFNFLFMKFISVFCKSSHPIVLFLDDLQWADLASLKFLSQLFRNQDINYLYFIGSYRDNEVDDVHPLRAILFEISKSGIPHQSIILKPLSADDVNKLASNFFRCRQEKSHELSQIVHDKTKGNPFFINQFLKNLYDNNYISLSPDRGWLWKIDEVKKLQVTDNVVELMAHKIITLKDRTIDTLKACACIGNRFDLETVAIVTRHSMDDVLKDIAHAIEEELIYRDGAVYRFLHDRIQEAAYSLIPEDKKKEMHHSIGWHLLKNSDDKALSEKILYIVNHCNASIALLHTDEEKLKIAGLNLTAAHKTKKSAAYESSLHYASTGIELIKNIDQSETEKWKNYYHLLAPLYVASIEATYLLHNYSAMDSFAAKIRPYMNTIPDKAKIYMMQILALNAQGKLKESVDFALQSINDLGAVIPSRPGRASLLFQFIMVKIKLTGWNKEKLMALPDMDEPRLKAMFKIFICSAPAVYTSRPNLMIYYIKHIIAPALRYGLSSEFVYAIISYGLINVFFGAIDAGYRYARMGIETMESRSHWKFSADNKFVYNMFVRHWKEDVRSTIESFTENYQQAIENGDVEWASMSIMGLCLHSFYAGEPLDETLELIDKHSKILLKLKHLTSLNLVNVIHQTVLNLQGNGEGNVRLLGPIYNEETGLKLFMRYYLQMMLGYIFEDFETAYEISKKARKHMFAVSGMVYITMYTYYDTLIRCQLIEGSSKKNRKKHWKIINKNLKKMKKWCRYQPMNLLQKLNIMEAEIARLQNKNENTLSLYDRAISAAKKNKGLYDEAIACELAGKYFLTMGNEELAAVYLTNAFHKYKQWGAKAKFEQLAKKYERLDLIFERKSSIRDKDDTMSGTALPTGSLQNLDIASIIKTSQAISGEIELNILLEKIMALAIENAGAEKGYLMLINDDDKKLYIEAKGSVNDIDIINSQPIEESGDLPLAIINFVSKTRNDIVIHDATQDSRFLNDAYIKSEEVKSILCAPIKHKGTMVGIIYLENNLSAGAFTTERLQVLQVISSQAAISIENARLLSQRENAVKLEAEMQIAANIQLSLIPKDPKIDGFEIVGYMKPADDVGGDYYDIINGEGINWAIIGDVSGHGVPAGLIMMMVQTVMQAVIRDNPRIKPSSLIRIANRALSYNIQNLGNMKYMTITVLSIYPDGRVVGSGLHQDILVYRSQAEKVEEIKSGRHWIGLQDDIPEDDNDDFEFTINPDDVMLLYTDGIVEAWEKGSIKDVRVPKLNMYGNEQLSHVFWHSGNQSLHGIRDGILQSLDGYDCPDDVTMLIVKRLDS